MQTSDNNTKTPVNERQYPEPKHIKLGEIEPPYHHGLVISYLLFVLCLFATLSIWIMQNSVNAYFLQTYHRESPLAALDHSVWLKGGEIGTALYAAHGRLTGKIADFNQQITHNFNEHYAYTPEYQAQMAIKAKAEVAKQAKLAEANRQKQLESQYILSPGDEIFFAGDSMMQGIAPHVQQYLQKTHNIQSVNLSKQSTGLAYPSFFDWPKTIEETLASNANIKILVVFLGPNDPWDMPDLQTKARLKFQTPEWEMAYRARIASILQSAHSRGVKVIWITPPNMKKQQLNEQMIYLSKVMQDELRQHDVLIMDSRKLLGTSDNVYNNYLVKNGETIKMRSSDGIHFSVEGQKLIAEALQQQLTILP